MLQFRLKRVIIRSYAEEHRVSIVCPDGAQYVLQFTTDDDDDDDDLFHEFEAYLLWNAMHDSDFRDEERTLIVIREVEHYAIKVWGCKSFKVFCELNPTISTESQYIIKASGKSTVSLTNIQ